MVGDVCRRRGKLPKKTLLIVSEFFAIIFFVKKVSRAEKCIPSKVSSHIVAFNRVVPNLTFFIMTLS